MYDAAAANGIRIAATHRFGKGVAQYYATALGLGYFRHPQAEVRRWIAAPALGRNAALPVEMTGGSEQIVFRGMVSPSQRVAILSSPSRSNRPAWAGRSGATADG